MGRSVSTTTGRTRVVEGLKGEATATGGLLWPPLSDLKPNGNDRLGYGPQAGVVVAGV
jgi:hypothetical protein